MVDHLQPQLKNDPGIVQHSIRCSTAEAISATMGVGV